MGDIKERELAGFRSLDFTGRPRIYFGGLASYLDRLDRFKNISKSDAVKTLRQLHFWPACSVRHLSSSYFGRAEVWEIESLE